MVLFTSISLIIPEISFIHIWLFILIGFQDARVSQLYWAFVNRRLHEKWTKKAVGKVQPVGKNVTSRVCDNAGSHVSLQSSNWVSAFVLSRPELLLPAGCCPSVVTTLTDCAQSDTSILSSRICLSSGSSLTWQRDSYPSWKDIHFYDVYWLWPQYLSHVSLSNGLC